MMLVCRADDALLRGRRESRIRRRAWWLYALPQAARASTSECRKAGHDLKQDVPHHAAFQQRLTDALLHDLFGFVHGWC